MSKIAVRFVLELQDGKLDALRDVANRFVSSVRENDKGTLPYDWYLSPDEKACVVLETAAFQPTIHSIIATL